MHGNNIHELFVGHKQLIASTSPSGLSTLLGGKVRIHKEVCIDSLAAQHSVICSIVAGQSRILSSNRVLHSSIIHTLCILHTDPPNFAEVQPLALLPLVADTM